MKFPRIQPYGTLDPDLRAGAVDYVNRVNWLFETWDLEAMIASFAPDAQVYHFKGTMKGESEIRDFLTNAYPYLVPGVSRNASNHIVDQEENGLIAVRYQNLLVRYADYPQTQELADGGVIESDDLPMIWLYSPMLDRLRRTEDGWRIAERYIGGSTTNRRYTPVDTSAETARKYLPAL